MQDRRPDVAPGEGERLVGLAADLVVERGVVERIGQFGGQSGVGQRGLDKVARGLSGSRDAFFARGVEQAGAERRIERPDGVSSVLGAHLRRDPQQLQSRGVALLVMGGEVRRIVDVRR